MRPLRLLLAASLVTALVAVPAATSSADTGKAACRRSARSVLVLRTLHIEAVPSKTKVHPGEKFPVEVTVTRPAHEDPVGQGIEFEPPASVPAADVTVGLSVYVGDVTYFWQVGKTDSEGKATLMLTVPQNSELGWAYAMASARHWIKNDCPDILEDGYTTYPKFVKVVP